LSLAGNTTPWLSRVEIKNRYDLFCARLVAARAYNENFDSIDRHIVSSLALRRPAGSEAEMAATRLANLTLINESLRCPVQLANLHIDEWDQGSNSTTSGGSSSTRSAGTNNDETNY
jgi:hypothetical protein